MGRSKVLVLDMYGVIIEESKGNFIPYTFQHFDRTEHERLKRAIREEQCFTRAQLGELTSGEFLTYLGYEKPQETMEDYLRNYLTLDGQFRSFVEEFSQVMDFCLLSNDVAQWSSFLTEYHGLNPYFKKKLVSGEVHLRKPDREIFRLTVESLGCEPGDCIFVDNSVKNLLAACEVGMQTVLFNRDGEEYEGDVVNSFLELGELLKGMR